MDFSDNELESHDSGDGVNRKNQMNKTYNNGHMTHFMSRVHGGINPSQNLKKTTFGYSNYTETLKNGSVFENDGHGVYDHMIHSRSMQNRSANPHLQHNDLFSSRNNYSVRENLSSRGNNSQPLYHARELLGHRFEMGHSSTCTCSICLPVTGYPCAQRNEFGLQQFNSRAPERRENFNNVLQGQHFHIPQRTKNLMFSQTFG